MTDRGQRFGDFFATENEIVQSVQRLSPAASDETVKQYLAEIETMSDALDRVVLHLEPLVTGFSPWWRVGDVE